MFYPHTKTVWDTPLSQVLLSNGNVPVTPHPHCTFCLGQCILHLHTFLAVCCGKPKVLQILRFTYKNGFYTDSSKSHCWTTDLTKMTRKISPKFQYITKISIYVQLFLLWFYLADRKDKLCLKINFYSILSLLQSLSKREKLLNLFLLAV